MALFCSCGCHDGVVLKIDKDIDGKIAFLSLVSDKFYSEQNGFFLRLGEKIKRIWRILRNKEYCYFEIVLKEKDIEEFKGFVNKM